jgi:hypothetical protein
MAYSEADRPHETDFHAVTLSDPNQFEPQAHLFWEERVSWLGVDDGLPRHAGDGSSKKIRGRSKKR